MSISAAKAGWQRVTFASRRATKACGHIGRVGRTWRFDCSAPASFARPSAHGGQDWACSKHAH